MLEYKEVETDPADIALKVTLKGLRGGHSGLEINEGRANANKLMARFMNQVITYDERLAWCPGKVAICVTPFLVNVKWSLRFRLKKSGRTGICAGVRSIVE